MPHRIPQSVALRVPLKAYLASDHVSDATTKTLAVTISKNGAAFGNPSVGATNAAEIANGWYYVDLSTTDTGTLGPLVIRAAVATVDPVEIVYQVVDANSLGAAYLDAAVSTRSTYAGADTAGTTTLLGRVPGTVQPQTGDAYARIGVAGAGLTAVGDARLANLDAAVSGVATGVWAVGTRTLTSFGSLAADAATAVWGAATRTLSAFGFTVAATVSDKTGYGLTSAYDPAKTAAQAGDAMALTSGERTSTADALLARAIAAESYAVDGATPTLSQVLWMIWAGLVDFSITGTTLTVKKQDGTAAMTFTLDDATTPTSRTRAT